MKLANDRIERKAQGGTYMTVRDLIEELEGHDPDALVVFSTSYGDYNRTMQALPIESVDELDACEIIADSAYSQSGMSIENAFESGLFDDEDDTVNVPHPECGVVVLR
jgi:hypothetical protein